MITIIDYGMGNIASIQNMLKRIGVSSKLSGDVEEIYSGEKLILPGVGHFGKAMENINRLGLREVLNKKVLEEKTPILGICLGAQLLTKHSEEGNVEGLGWINANTVRFDLKGNTLKIPHMGWNEVEVKKQSRLFDGLKNSRFYFVHSYHMKSSDSSNILVTADYGYDFVCGLEQDNIIGLQFHPEKSHKFGMSILDNFSKNY